MFTQIYNGRILTADGRWIRNGSLIIKDDKIYDILPDSRIQENTDNYLDARGGYVMPGGIDMHVHGAGGKDFMEATPEAFDTIIRTHRRFGTTSLLPTLASTDEQTQRKAAEICTALMADPRSGVLGLHLEGPYFNPEMVGGQMPENIRIPSEKEYISMVEEFPCIRRWDSAPELPGALEFARYISGKGIIAGIAHTKADYPVVKAAVEAGYSYATHFFNAMTTSHKVGPFKHEGTVESIFLFDSINIEVIADGIHVPPAMLRLAYKFKGAERMCLVTDALDFTASDSATGIDPRIVIENGVGMLRDHSAIAGSVATMDRLIRTAALQAEIPLEDVSRMVSETPAKLTGVFSRKGSLAKGKDADIIIMDENLNLTHVLTMGTLVPIS